MRAEILAPARKSVWLRRSWEFGMLPRLGESHARYYHWYISVIPRLTRVAGFELGSGMFINTVLPETAADFLRKVDANQKIVGAAG